MSARCHLPLKSITAPDCPRAAAQPVNGPAVGAPKGVAEGVDTALRSNRNRHDQPGHDTGDPTPDRPGIRIYAPPVYRHHYDGARWSKRYCNTPTAACACPCGVVDSATGAREVARLVELWNLHRSACTGTPVPHEEGRAAA
ncbi:hypothetical protein ABT160_39255 [Streptomyces sp. NPDC001941]|uniref:hypothetical protein n=1 Tax=Streptomyces sp. NPDC001941 TaxID=3154659 RepID=UPI003324A9BA